MFLLHEGHGSILRLEPESRQDRRTRIRFEGRTVVFTVCALFAGVGSPSIDVAFALAVSSPCVAGLMKTVTWRLCRAPFGRLPIVQVSLLPARVQPGPDEKVTPGGRSRVTATPVAARDPELVTPMV